MGIIVRSWVIRSSPEEIVIVLFLFNLNHRTEKNYFRSQIYRITEFITKNQTNFDQDSKLIYIFVSLMIIISDFIVNMVILIGFAFENQVGFDLRTKISG